MRDFSSARRVGGAQVNFIHLVEMITGKAITSKYFKNPSLDIQRIENISIALAHLRKARSCEFRRPSSVVGCRL